MGVKRHSSGGYIGTNRSGRYISGTKSDSRVGAHLALMSVPLIGFSIVILAFGASFIVMLGAVVAAGWGLIMIWASAIPRLFKTIVTFVVPILLYELAFNVLALGVDNLSEPAPLPVGFEFTIYD